MSRDEVEYTKSVPRNIVIARSCWGADLEPAAQNIFAEIARPRPEDLVAQVIESMFRDFFVKAAIANSHEAWVGLYKEHAEEFARRRYAAGLLMQDQDPPVVAIARAIPVAGRLADEAREPAIQTAFAISLDTIRRANLIRDRIATHERLHRLLARGHHEEYAAHCLAWAWGYGCGLAICRDAATATDAARVAAEHFMVLGSRFAYTTYRRIEWDDMVPTERELASARVAFAPLGIQI